MARPVVVQGTAVAPPYSASPYGSGTAVQSGGGDAAPSTGTKCQDPLFAVLLYINVGAIAAVAAVYGPKAFDTTAADSTTYDYSGYLTAAIALAIISFAGSGLGMLVSPPPLSLTCDQPTTDSSS